MRRPRIRHLALLVVVVLAGCTTGGGSDDDSSPRRNRNLITRAEIEASSASDCFDLVQQLRPSWLVVRGGRAGSGQPYLPVVLVDGIPRGEPGTLGGLSPRNIAELRYLNSADATTRYGTGYPAGIIHVTTMGR